MEVTDFNCSDHSTTSKDVAVKRALGSFHLVESDLERVSAGSDVREKDHGFQKGRCRYGFLYGACACRGKDNFSFMQLHEPYGIYLFIYFVLHHNSQKTSLKGEI